MLACAKETLELSLAGTSFGSSELASLQNAFSKSEKTNLMVRSLIGQRATFIPLFRTNVTEVERVRKVERREESQPLTGRRAWSYRMVQFLDRDLSFFLDAMETNIAALTLSSPGNLLAENRAQVMIAVAKQRQYVRLRDVLTAVANAHQARAKRLGASSLVNDGARRRTLSTEPRAAAWKS